MNGYKFFMSIVILLLLSSFGLCSAQDHLDYQALESALKQLQQYDYGQDIEILNVIDQGIILAHNDRALKTKLEDVFISVLRSNASSASKEYVCRKLMHIGSAKSVSVLGTLLNDPDLTHMALFALERIPDKAVDRVMRDALDETSGLAKVGVINSLGNRRDSLSVENLIEVFRDDELDIKKAVAIALGKIGTLEATRALEEYVKDAPHEIYRSIQDGRLRGAENLTQKGHVKNVLPIYQDIYQNGQEPHIRLAGFRGLLLSESSKVEQRLLDALCSDDSNKRGFAARMVSEMPSGQDMTTYIQTLEQLPTAGQAALIDAFAMRGECPAAPTVRKLAGSSNPNIRDVALKALGKIGDASDVLLLAQVAARGEEEKHWIARQSLVALKGPDVNRQIVESLQKDDKQVRVELINCLVARIATSTAKDIGEYLNDSDQKVRLVALKALGELGGRTEVVRLIDFLNKRENNKDEAGALSALRSLCGRLGEESADPILAGLKKASKIDRLDLLSLLPLVGTDTALQAARNAANNQDPDIQNTGIRMLAQWPKQGAREDLQKLANKAGKLNHRVLAFRGYIRLLKQSDMSGVDKAKRLRDAVRRAERREEKVLALSGFGDIHSLESLKRMEHFIYNEDIYEEACTIVVKICSNLGTEHKTDIAVALIQVLQITKNDRTTKDARVIMRKLNIRPVYYLGEKPSTDSRTKRIVFIAGPMDHAGPGAHEYPKDLILLKKCLDTSTNVKNFCTEIYFGKVPSIEVLKDASTIVVHSSADRAKGEIHALFPSFNESYGEQEKAYYNQLDLLCKKGLGVVVLHYAVWTDKPESRAYMLDWIGGYHKKGQSRVKVVTANVQPATSHPILYGVKSWTTQEEYYFMQHLVRDNRFVPILHTPSLDDNSQQDTIAWAVERKGGGRGFGFTGCHYHHNLIQLEDYRQVVLNAILWTAGIEIPRQGVISKVPDGWN